MKTLDQWLSWQETLHPEEIELGLERIRTVAVALDLLTPQARVVTVAGTNGKGSSIALLDAVVRSGGLKTGVYTSPHLLRYNERISINGEPVSDQALCEAFEAIDQVRGETSLTYFEFGTLAAFYLFKQHPLDLWILEVGLGGRLDAVNLIDADVALLTTVDLDHQAWLGESREEIGREKAGVFRCGCPAVIGEVDPPASVIEHANRIGAPLRRYRQDFGFSVIGQGWSWMRDGEAQLQQLPQPALPGVIQLQNSAAALEVVAQLGWLERIGPSGIERGLTTASLRGRFETVATAPEVIVDVSHNPQAAAVLAQNLLNTPCRGKTWAVVGMLKDKEVERVIETVASQVDHWMVCELEGSRAALSEIVQTVTGADPLQVLNPLQGLQMVRQQAIAEDRIVVFGSFYTVAAVLEEQ